MLNFKMNILFISLAHWSAMSARIQNNSFIYTVIANSLLDVLMACRILTAWFFAADKKTKAICPRTSGDCKCKDGVTGSIC